jgi:hypothetical protein
MHVVQTRQQVPAAALGVCTDVRVRSILGLPLARQTARSSAQLVPRGCGGFVHSSGVCSSSARQAPLGICVPGGVKASSSGFYR